MKLNFAILYIASLFLSSIVTMIYGWGLQPKNWGWIAFGFLWVMMPALFAELVKAVHRQGRD